MSDLSVIIPCFNEEKNLVEIVKQIKVVKEENKNIFIEFIVVNNGSTDNSSSKLIKLNDQYNFKIVDLDKTLVTVEVFWQG